MHFPAGLLLLANWFPKPGPAAAAASANQNVLANAPASPSAAIESPPSSSPSTTTTTTTTTTNSPSPPWTCPPLSHRPLTVAELSTTFPPRANLSAAAAASVEAIKRQLTLYAFAIDGRDWAALDHVFAPRATADYGPPINTLSGRDAIKRTLPPYLTVFAGTQHVLGTQVVDLCGGGEGDGEGHEAVSVTYFTAAHFKEGTAGKGLEAPVGVGEVMYAFGQYQDRWERDGGDGVWRIVHRNLVYMGPFVSGA